MTSTRILSAAFALLGVVLFGVGAWWVMPQEYRGENITPGLVAEAEGRMGLRFPAGAEFLYLRLTRFPDRTVMLKFAMPAAEGPKWLATTPFAETAMSAKVNAVQMNNPPPEWDGPGGRAFVSGVVKRATGLLAARIVEGVEGSSAVYLKLVDGVTFAEGPKER